MKRFLALVLGAMALASVHARDFGQWNNDPEVAEWFRTLMQPDNPAVSCCGEADAYWCDEVHVRDGKTYCNITDDRPDEPRRRIHVPVGTEIFIPDKKLKWDKGNPTGHAIVFLMIVRPYTGETEYSVYCFVQMGGV